MTAHGSRSPSPDSHEPEGGLRPFPGLRTDGSAHAGDAPAPPASPQEARTTTPRRATLTGDTVLLPVLGSTARDAERTLPPGAGIPLTRRSEGVRARKAVAAGSRW